MEQERPLKLSDYSPGHPWHYVLGATPPFPRQILARVKEHGYRGYKKNDIQNAAAKAEPARSAALRAIRDEARLSLFANLSRYREVVRGLRQYCENPSEQPCFCTDVHQSVSLKHNHIYNDFAHLVWLDELLSEQRDLFDF